MVTIGHTIQVVHVLAVVFVAYSIGRGWGAIVGAWILLVLVTNWACGACPVTIVSNVCFRTVGAPEYSDVGIWMAMWVGEENAVILGRTLFVGSVCLGLLHRWIARPQ